MNENLQIGAALADAKDKLQAVSESPRLDAELLLSLALDVPRSYLFAHPEDTLDDAAAQRFAASIERRERGMPIAYLTGEKEFWSLTLTVTPDTLVPRPETEILVTQALHLARDEEGFRVLDLGTGSGAIALAIARECPRLTVVATDASEAALKVAQENANRLMVPNVEFRAGDWAAPVVTEKFDLVVSNPPYVADDDPALDRLQSEPRAALAAGPDGLDAIRRIAVDVRPLLRPGGSLLLEHGETQREAVAGILAAAGWTDIRHVDDYAGKPRVTIAAG